MKRLSLLLLSAVGLVLAGMPARASTTWTDTVVDSSPSYMNMASALGSDGYARWVWMNSSNPGTLTYGYQDANGTHSVTFTAAQVGVSDLNSYTSSIEHQLGIALDSNNTPHLVFGGNESGGSGATAYRGLWYGTYVGPGPITTASNWHFQRVVQYTDPNGGLDVESATIAIDPTVNRPAVMWWVSSSLRPGGGAYYQDSTIYYTTRNADGSFSSASGVLSSSNTLPPTPGGTTIAAQVIGNGGAYTQLSFAISASGKHAFATPAVGDSTTGNANIIEAGTDISGSWATTAIETVDSTLNVAYTAAVAFDPNNLPRVVWSDLTNGNQTNLATTADGATWSISPVMAGLSPLDTNYGALAFYAISSNFNELVVTEESTQDDGSPPWAVRTATRQGGTGAWTVQIAATNSDPYTLGIDVSPAISATGQGLIGFDTGYGTGPSTLHLLTTADVFPAVTTVPGAPTIGTAAGGVGQATVAFTAPASDGGAAITGYTVTSNPGGLTASGTSSPITITGLTNGTAYTFTVTATNSVGTGSASGASNSVTPLGLTVSTANISVSGASGTAGAFRIGDTVTATWNNTGSGDNNSGVTGVTADFTQFGGGSAVTATNSAGVWTATYTILAGSINRSNAKVSFTATNSNSTTATAAGPAVTVDNISPVVTSAKIALSGATGTSGTYRIGDTVTVTWNDTAGGDNNTDTIGSGGVTMNLSAFGGGSAVAATNTGGIWTATYTLISGSISTATARVAVTVTDHAGNSTTTSSGAVAVDTRALTVTSGHITLSGGSGPSGEFRVGDTITASWNDTAGGDNNAGSVAFVTMNFSAFGGGSAVPATNSGGIWTATYTVTSGSNYSGNAQVAVTATDSGGNVTTTDGSNLSVDDVVPVLTADQASAVFVEADDAASTPVAVDPGLAITNAGHGAGVSATVSITGNFHSSEDVLSYLNSDSSRYGDITGSYDAATGVLTLTSASESATTAQWTNALESVTYSDTAVVPDTSTRTVSFTFTDADGNTSRAVSRTVIVVHTDQTPIVTATPGATAFVTGAGAVVLDSGLTVSDSDNATLASAVVSISSGFAAGDVLNFVSGGSMGNIAGSYDSSTGVLTLTSAGGLATLAQWQAALRSVSFNNSNSTPSAATRTVSFAVNDGANTSVPASKSVTVGITPVVVSAAGPAASTYYAGQTLTFTLTFNEAVAVDTTNGTPALSITLGTANHSANYVSGAGTDTLTFSYTVQVGDEAAGGISVTSPIVLNSGVISSGALNANLAYTPPATSSVLVNTLPVVTTTTGSTAFVAGDDGPSTPVAVDAGLTVADPSQTTLASATVAITGNFQVGEDVLGLPANNPAIGNIVVTDYNNSLGVLTLTSAGGSATLAQWQAALAAVTYTDTAITPNNATRTVSFTVNDGVQTSLAATKTVTVADTDQTPVLGGASSSASFVTGSDPVSVDPGISVSDLDNGTLASGVVAITGNFQAGDVLGFTPDGTMGNISGVYDSSTGVLTLTSGGDLATIAQWQSALQAVTFSNPAATPSPATRTVSFTVNDGTKSSSALTTSVTVGITPVVTAAAGPGAGTYHAGQTLSFTLTYNVPVTVDTTGGTPGLTISVGGTAHTANYASGSGTTTLTFTYPVQVGDEAAGGISVTSPLVLNGGTIAAGGLNAVLSYTAPSTATVLVNTLPVVTTTTGSTAFVAGDNTASVPVTIDAGLTVTDPSQATLASATVAITGNFQAGEDTLALPSNLPAIGNIAVTSYNSSLGVLTLTSAGGSATLAQWQAALAAVTYTDTAITPNPAPRTLSFTVNDGVQPSVTATKTVTLADTDQTPVEGGAGGTAAYLAGAGSVVVDNGITVSDRDNPTLASATVTISGNFQTGDMLGLNLAAGIGNITSSYNAATGVLTLTSAGATATDAQWQTALRAVAFYTATGSPATTARTISFAVSDGTESSAAVTQTVTVALPITPTITWPAPAAVAAGTALSGAQLDASATVGGTGIAGVYTYTPAAGAVLAPGSQTLSVLFTPSDTIHYTSASASTNLTVQALLPQTIAYTTALPPTVATSTLPFNLTATASSGLPVTYTVSGVATLSGTLLTLTGVHGTVTITASQAGNAQYAAAQLVSTITVTGRTVAIGSIAGSTASVFGGRTPAATAVTGTFGVSINAANTAGTMIGTIGGSGFVANLTLGTDGLFHATTTAIPAPGGSTVTGTLTFTAQLQGATFSGTISELNASFSATADPAAGTTAGISGFYQGSSIDAASGGTYSIVGTQGEVFVLAVTSNQLVAGVGTVNANDTFSVGTPGQAGYVSGTINPSNSTISEALTTASGAVLSFSGLGDTAVRTDRLINLSSRGLVSGSNVLSSGLVIGGSANKTVLLRAVGPGLGAFGVTGTLAHPHLQLFNAAGQVISDSTGWSSAGGLAATFAQVGAFPLTPNSADAAIEISLAPGQYTLQISNAGTDAGGQALAEIYDASANPAMEYQRLINISTRAYVSSGQANLTGGFIITGNNPKTVLVRGVGPALAAFGLADTLSDPALVVFDSSGNVLAQNDNWGTPVPVNPAQTVAGAADILAAETATGAFVLPAGSKDAALIVTLPPGAYTAQVTGVGGGTGTALVEIYEIPAAQ